MSEATDTIVEELLQAKFEERDLKSYTKEWMNKRGEHKKAGPFTYVEDETVMDRLDLVLGLGGWSVKADPMGDNVVRVTLTIRHPKTKEWSEYQDFGYATNPDSPEPLKEAWTDAFRRVARLPGVARYVYAGEVGPPPATQTLTAAPVANHDALMDAATRQALAREDEGPEDAEDRCPEHGTAWTVKAAGNNKTTGKPYKAFWKCDGKTNGSYCNNKPSWDWVKAHPAA